MIRVLIAEDHDGARETLSQLLLLDDSIHLVGAAGDADEASRFATERPDVALIDVNMPGGGGSAATRGILERSPSTKVLALSAYDDRKSVREMIKAGAVGYIVKGTAGAEILDSIRRAARGEGILSTEVTAGVLEELAERLEREDQQSEHERVLTRRIRSVLEGNALATVFQPIVDLRLGEVVGYEALARFDAEPKRPPDVWFAEATEVGLGAELELAALRAALLAAKQLPQDAYVSVNLSPDTALSRGFVEVLSGATARQAVVEITEHAPVNDYDALRSAVGAMRTDGGRLAIDDAGAGFASLTHILRLNPEFIKLDVSLTRGIDRDRARRALARALISFADEIGATIVAEGIETGGELEALRDLDVGFGQGYYLGRPQPLHALDEGVQLDLIA